MFRRLALFGDILLIVLIGASLVLRSFLLIPDTILIFLNILAFIPLLISAGRYAVHRKISVELLASIALFASMVSGEWLSAAFINLMLASARAFQRFVEDRGRRAIRSLAKLRPADAAVRRDGIVLRIPFEKVAVGDELVIVSGEYAAADGKVIEGSGDVDESSITGESVPVEKGKGEVVVGGTILLSGGLVVKVERVGDDAVLGRMMRLVSEAESRESRLQSIASKFASIYVIASLLVAGAIFFFSHDLRLVLSVLLVVCADDIAVAIPLAFLAAISAAAAKGAVVKGAPFIENIAKARTFFFDKTGTITTGKMEVANKVVFSGMTEDISSAIASTLALSTHPSAFAVSRFLSPSGLSVPVSQFNEERGLGMTSLFKDGNIIAGKPKFLKEKGVAIGNDVMKVVDSMFKNGSSVMMVAWNGAVIAVFELKDGVRREAKSVIKEIESYGARRMIMLTGDNGIVAGNVAGSVGISEFRSDLLPEDKVDIVRSKEFSPPVVMVGDGVNDAAALAAADVGIAMGGIGSEAAVESADIVLMKDDLSAIPDVLRISRETFTVVKQNIVIWAVVNIVGLTLVFTGVIGPSGAAAFNFLTDFIPIFNSIRIFGYRRPDRGR